MSFADEYSALRKKRKKSSEELAQEAIKNSMNYSRLDIAPVANATPLPTRDIAPVRTTTSKTEDEKDDGWFKNGEGNVFQNVLGTIGDAGVGIAKGALGMIEGVADLILYGGNAVYEGITGLETNFEKDIAESTTDQWLGGAEDFVDKYSYLGDKSDAISQGVGQVGLIIATGGAAGALGASAAGVTAVTTAATGLSSMGGGMGEAFQSGATEEEAWAYGAMKGAVDAGTELIFGGLGKAVNAVGLSKGISSLDDAFAKKLSSKISSQFWSNAVEFGVKAGAEGTEEVLAGIGSAVAKKLTYMDEEELGQLIKDEQLLDQFVAGAVTSGIAQSGIVPAMQSGSLIEANKQGADFITGYTQNEQAVIDTEYNNRVAEAEKDGKKLTKKEKAELYEQVQKDLEKGYISTDTIESVLGGEDYSNYHREIERQNAADKELAELRNMKSGEMSDVQKERMEELKLMKPNTEMMETLKFAYEDNIRNSLTTDKARLKRGSYLAESYNERARRREAFKVKNLAQYGEKEAETIQKAIDSGILNNTNRTHEFVDMVAKISADKGVSFDFTNNQKLKESGFAMNGKTVNGYVTKDGITINVNSAKGWQSVVGHEISHVLEGTELYTEMQSALFEYAKSKKDFDGRRKNLEELYKNVKDANIDAELTADLVGDYLFTDEGFIANLSTKHRNVFQKIYDEVKYLLKIATAGSKEARDLERVKRAFDKAYKADTKASGDTKYSLSDSDGNIKDVSTGYADGESYYTMSYEQDGKTVATLEYGEYDGKPNVKMVEVDPEYRRKGIGTKLLQELQKKYPDTEIDFGMTTPAGTKLLDAITYDVTDENIAADRQKLKGLQTELNDLQGKLDSLYELVDNGINLTEAQETELHELGDRWNEVYDSIRKLEKSLQGKRATKTFVKTDVQYSLSSDSNGRQLSDGQKEYFKDSKVVDENGNLKVVYHGSPTEFNTFSLEFLGTNGTAEGYGFYFTDKKSIAEGYSKGREGQQNGETGKLFEVYLDIKKPLSDTEVTMSRKQFKELLIALNNRTDADGEKLDILSNYGDVEWEGLNKVLDYAMEIEYDGSDSDVSMVHSLINGCGNMEAVFDELRKVTGYDGIIVEEATWGGEQTIYLAFHPEQIKSVDNENPTGDPDIRYSLSRNAELMQNADDFNNDNLGIDLNMARQQRQEIYDYMMRNADRLKLPEDIEGNTAIKNSSYDITEENTTVCIRSMAADALCDAVAEELGRPLTVQDTLRISQDLMNYTDEPECVYCYVATDRKAYREFLGSYYKQMQNAIKEIRSGKNPDEVYKTFLDGRKDTKNMRARFAMWEKIANGGKMISAKDLASEKMMQNAMRDPELSAQVKDARAYAQSASWAKKRMGYQSYDGHILDWSERRVNDLNKHYGLRFYSFSDFSPAFVLENMQQMTDAAVRGLKGLAYTKVLDFAEIFAPTGININISVFGYDQNGEVAQDGMMGADWKGAQDLRNRYENVGITFVATNDAQIEWALNQDWIDVVIPYHLVRTGKAVAEHFGYTNYTSESGDTKGANWKKGDKKTIYPSEHNNDKHTYLAALAEANLEPRFARFVNHPNYMKLVNETRRSAKETPPMKAEFNVEAAKASLDGMMKRGGYFVPIGGDYANMQDIAGEIADSIRGGQLSLSQEGEAPTKHGGYYTPLKDLALDNQDIAPVQETVDNSVAEAAPVVGEKVDEVVAPDAKSAADLADIAKQARRDELHGAYTQGGKQYISDGSFIAELNTVDESLEQSKDFPVKRVQKELAEAFDRQLDSKYEIATDIADGYIKVGDSLFDAKYVNAVIRAIENPVFTLSHMRGGDNALLVTGENGRAVLMPVRAGDNVNVAYEAQPVVDAPVAEMPSEPNLQDLYAEKADLENRIREAMAANDQENGVPLVQRYQELTATIKQMEADESERLNSITDADAPVETEAPYYGESEAARVDDPFENRDIDKVGNRKIKAYMYENPEVRPFFQEEANLLLGELQRTEKPQTIYLGDYKYKLSYDAAKDLPELYRTKRVTTPDIAYMRDSLNMSYADIEKGLKAIIEDHGAENIAAAKKIEFIINDRLMKGYDVDGIDVPPNQDYINLLNEKQITEYSEEARKQFFDVADEYAPPEDIAPVAAVAEEISEAPVKEKYEAIRPKRTKEPSLKRVTDEDIAPTFETKNADQIKGQQTMFDEGSEDGGKTAEVLTEEPETEKKKSRGWSKFKTNFLDKGAVFEDLSLKTKNRELMGKWNHTLSSESRAQWLIGKGTDGVKSLNDIRAEVEDTGLTKDFYEYLYHKHNVDRMSIEGKAEAKLNNLQGKFDGLKLEQIKAIAAKEITDKTTERTAQWTRDAKEYLNALEAKNKPVFGDSVTAEVSQEAVNEYEKKHPEFKALAQDVYDYTNHLRSLMVENGVISQETADLWAEMYPNYVPVRRAGHEGAAVTVPLDTGRTGVNAPIKRATGGNSDILPLFDTLALRTEQTFKAIARNSFGVELKNTLGTTVESNTANLDEIIDSIDTHEELLKKGEKGKNPTFTVFEDGKRVEFEITEDMYDALKPTSDGLKSKNKVLGTATKIQRGLLTEYNPVFMATNAIKDVQDILVNSQHAAKTYANLPSAIKEMVTKGKWYQEYMENGGEQNTYFDSENKTFTKDDTGIKKLIGIPLRGISAANNFIERLPRLAEYIASRKSGASVEVAMLDAARVTTNFAAGGDVTKFLDRNGATFLNASVQGFNQQVRNIREAKANGLKGWAQLAAKFAVAGLPAVLLNHLMWDDDEEYEELSDYVKDNYYVVAKMDDGTFVRIPKGRALAVIQKAMEQISNAATGDDEADLESFLELAISNLAPNNPLDSNIFAPIMQVANNETWYGEDLVPTRLQDLPDAEQYDESTDSISKWLGEKLDYSPYKINYLLNQYSGGVGDVFLPMLTPEAESGDNSFGGNIIAPFKDKFSTDSVMNNQNISDFYDTVDELAKNANSMYATDADALSYKYMNSISSDIGELYQKKREIQNSYLSDAEKYEAVREIQDQINSLARESLATYGNVNIDGGYATVGDLHYRWYEPSEDSDAEAGWQKITGKQLEKQEKVTGKLGISASEYWSNKEEYDYAYDYPEKYAVAKSVGGYKAFRTYASELYDIKADKDEDGKSISGSRKEKVIDYVNSLDIDYGMRIILFKSEYNADDTYNYDILDYLNSRNDISYEEMATILKELGFTVHSNGRVTW